MTHSTRSTRSTSTPRHGAHAMDVMRPWQAFGTPAAATDDARKWLRQVFLTLIGASATLLLLGATAKG